MTNPSHPVDPTQDHVSQPGPAGLENADAAARSRQAAWRFSARMKNNTAAWIMWAAAPFVVGVPIHDFYLGSILRGLIKVALVIIAWGAFMASYFGFIFAVVGAGEDAQVIPNPGPMLWVGFGLTLVCWLVLTVWWIYDGFIMTKRIDARNDSIRQETAQELAVDPWSF
ncbi:hypothetical protein [Kocuria sp.]|uniref:hypothetical protein n=1 Tax=Kocuria sp. TaxID=1871328 RepID=UPI0026DF8DEE|nr:hypothetical protein [Kocuria sp.]MDO5618818.1 hypothetical protein [Kocuria sp.]